MELLAPCGAFNCVTAAVNSGADAVYFAGQSFGARSYAGNLTDEEIFRACDFCHLHGVRVYVTVNTLVFDREYRELDKFIKTITRAGADGVIVQDLGVLRRIRELSPDTELHASTQMTVCSTDGVHALEKLGVSRVVLPRELSSGEIRRIIAESSAEAEVFVHGAMCMCYSGQCLMSSVIGGRSGNRGKCAQPCRLPYSDGTESGKYYLSLKDMSLAEHVNELKDMGVASFKIEGRMKGSEYVGTVVSIYRRLIDEGRMPDARELDELNRVFFRGGLSDGYYNSNIGSQMFAFDKPDNPYLKNDSAVHAVPQERRRFVDIYARLAEGGKPHIRLTSGNCTAEASLDEEVQTAARRALTEDSARAQLTKLGDTVFSSAEVNIELSENPFVPISVLNELRRQGVSALEQKILEPYKSKRIIDAPIGINSGSRALNSKLGFTCSVCTIGQYRAIKDFNSELIYVPLHIAEQYAEELLENKTRIAVCPPVIIRGADRAEYKKRMENMYSLGFTKAECHTIDGFGIAEAFEKFGGYRLNITNSLSAAEYYDSGLAGICLSPELNAAQMRDILNSAADVSGAKKTEIIAYGRLPLMITANCVLKNMDKCPCKDGGKIYDRTGAEFTVVRDGDTCTNVILNSVPLYMGDKMRDLEKTGADRLRLMFTTESADECRSICMAYANAEAADGFEYTRLRYYKPPLE